MSGKEYHNIAPLFDENSRVLILGSFPSVRSRETGFFYGHPQNRFWRLMAYIFKSDIPLTVDDKKSLLLRNRIALWDVLASCDIRGSSDMSIKDAVPNDISLILDNCRIKAVLLNGRSAFKYYNKFLYEKCKIYSLCMSSTSPANASKSFEKLCDEWGNVLNDLLK